MQLFSFWAIISINCLGTFYSCDKLFCHFHPLPKIFSNNLPHLSHCMTYNKAAFLQFIIWHWGLLKTLLKTHHLNSRLFKYLNMIH